MKKKTFIVILLLLGTALTAACACLPSSVFEKYFLTSQPVEPPAAGGTATLDPSDPSAACSDELGSLLWEAENDDTAGRELDAEYTLATYEVSGGTISAPSFPPVPEELQPLQQDAAAHQELWSFITGVIPAGYRRGVRYFILFTDGPAGTLGAVEQTADPEEWMLEVDIQDAADFPTLTTTLIHEMTHMLTLNTSQVVTDERVFDHPEDDSAYAEGDAACSTYFLFEGCSNAESYINLFFENYWETLYPEWLEIDPEQDGEVYDNLLAEFYGRHAGEFVSSYAVTSPEEDIAESFMYFILSPRPAGETIAEEKILFFYEFPELVTLRTQMRTSLCPYVMP